MIKSSQVAMFMYTLFDTVTMRTPFSAFSHGPKIGTWCHVISGKGWLDLVLCHILIRSMSDPLANFNEVSIATSNLERINIMIYSFHRHILFKWMDGLQNPCWSVKNSPEQSRAYCAKPHSINFTLQMLRFRERYNLYKQQILDFP